MLSTIQFFHKFKGKCLLPVGQSFSMSKLLQSFFFLSKLVTEIKGGFPEQGLSQHMVWSKSKSACSYSSSSPETLNHFQWDECPARNGWNSIQLVGLMQLKFWSNTLNSSKAMTFLLSSFSFDKQYSESSVRLALMQHDSRIWCHEFYKLGQVTLHLLSSNFGPL